MSSYEETLNFLYTRLPMYQRVGKAAYKADLSNTVALLDALDNPQQDFKSVHIAGTNGKGTSAHTISAILQSAGYKAGLYTSPHLKSFTERIRINGQEIPQEAVVMFVDRIREEIERIKPSFFEITVAMAFSYFSEQEVDIAVIETGLGGRLDSTNVIAPEVSLITNIGWDHMDLLGDTLPKIAAEKAGIIKPGVPVVIGTHQQEVHAVFEEVAQQQQAELLLASADQSIPVPDRYPDYFKANVPGIIKTVETLSGMGYEIPEPAITTGILNVNQLTGLKGRFQVLDEEPLTIADISHNEDGLRILFQQVKRMLQGDLHLIFGSVKDKDLSPLLDLIPASTHCYWTQAAVPRSLPVDELAKLAKLKGLGGTAYAEVNTALSQARNSAGARDLILITGSTFVVAELDGL